MVAGLVRRAVQRVPARAEVATFRRVFKVLADARMVSSFVTMSRPATPAGLVAALVLDISGARSRGGATSACGVQREQTRFRPCRTLIATPLLPTTAGPCHGPKR